MRVSPYAGAQCRGMRKNVRHVTKGRRSVAWVWPRGPSIMQIDEDCLMQDARGQLGHSVSDDGSKK